MNTKKIEIRKTDVVYIDMDGVLVQSNESPEEWQSNKLKKEFFLNKKPIDLAIESFQFLNQHCDVYILSTPVWDNVHCWTEKRIWVEKHLGIESWKKLILSHNKGLNFGKLLIDDSTEHGVLEFTGEHIHFGSTKYPTWKEVINNLTFE